MIIKFTYCLRCDGVMYFPDSVKSVGMCKCGNHLYLVEIELEEKEALR